MTDGRRYCCWRRHGGPHRRHGRARREQCADVGAKALGGHGRGAGDPGRRHGAKRGRRCAEPSPAGADDLGGAGDPRHRRWLRPPGNASGCHRRKASGTAAGAVQACAAAGGPQRSHRRSHQRSHRRSHQRSHRRSHQRSHRRSQQCRCQRGALAAGPSRSWVRSPAQIRARTPSPGCRGTPPAGAPARPGMRPDELGVGRSAGGSHGGACHPCPERCHRTGRHAPAA